MAKTKKSINSAKPYGHGLYTEAQFWAFIRAGLRQKHQRWKPRQVALNKATRPIPPHKRRAGDRRRKEAKCADCKKWYSLKDVQADHIIGVGSLRKYDDLPRFVKNLFCECDGYQVLCKACHHRKTYKR